MRCPRVPHRWKTVTCAGWLAFPLLLSPASPSAPGEEPSEGPPLVSSAALLVGATPDCGTLPPEPYPEQQRALHLARLGVDHWHAAGYRGRGVKIAVLDSGF